MLTKPVATAIVGTERATQTVWPSPRDENAIVVRLFELFTYFLRLAWSTIDDDGSDEGEDDNGNGNDDNDACHHD